MPGSSTVAIHADRDVHPSRAVARPIYQTATFWAEDAEQFAQVAVDRRGHDFYTRYGNPNHAQVAAVVAELEHTEAAMVTASGMAALTTAVLALVSAGDHVIGQKSTYGGTALVLLNLLPRLGVSATQVDQTDPEAFEKALTPRTRLILVDTLCPPFGQPRRRGIPGRTSGVHVARDAQRGPDRRVRGSVGPGPAGRGHGGHRRPGCRRARRGRRGGRRSGEHLTTRRSRNPLVQRPLITMPRSRAFMQVDVFSATPCLGNPVAVVLDGTDVTDQEMQRLARWTNLSETTFILPPTAPEADYRLRIFAPAGELPFAGHPTLGSARAWLDNGGTPQHPGRIVQECAAGLVSVRHGEGILSFAAPPLVRDGPLREQFVGQIAAAFGINRDRVLAHQWVDNGPGWAVVQLPTAEEVLALEPDLSLIPTAMVGAIGAYPEGSGHAFEMRTFAPRVGVAEDPACGSMNAAVGQWLTATGAAPSTYRVSQGTRMGRAATIEITADADGTVWAGGAATAYIRGTITL